MEETSGLSQKPTKSVATQRPNKQSRSSRRGGSSKVTKNLHTPNPLAAGQVAFRMLCRGSTTGGVIGNAGSIIKHLETQTGSKIQFEEGQPKCFERVINIVGDSAVEKKITMSVGDDKDDDLVDVSKAQEGLLRVFERVLEVEGNVENKDTVGKNKNNRDGSISCRLLVPLGRVGAVMGKGGKIVNSIRKSSGATIRVLKKEQIPACAGSEVELIQISGGAMAVKKALLAVTNCLQDRILEEGDLGQVSPHGSSQSLNSEFISSNRSNLPSFSGNAVNHHSVGQSFSEDFKRPLKVEDESSLRKVVFKYICSNHIADGVIGKGANIVKFLEKETGASIKFASLVTGSKERLAIISSLENPNALYSPAQIAIIRVFSRCMEISLDMGLLSSLGNGEKVTASIMVASTQVNCLLNEDGRVTSEISVTSGVEIKLIEEDIQNYAAESDRVVQITGEYDNVKNALFQVTGRLRENVFSGKGLQGADLRHCSYLAMSKNRPNGGEEAPSARSLPLSTPHIDQLDPLGGKPSNNPSTGLRKEQIKKNRRGSISKPADSPGSSKTLPSVLENEIKVATKILEQSVEIVIPVKEFGLVFGENHSNLARLKEISGAAVILKDPSPGDSFGKVIISGRPEQIQIAQSLLQAFILS